MPSVVNKFIESDLFCITVENWAPIGAVSTVLTPFTVDISASGAGVINSATVDWGDGSSDPLVAGAPPSYGESHTYASAGTYLVKVVVILDTGETNGPDGEWFQVEVV